MNQMQLIAVYGNPMTDRVAFETKYMKTVDTMRWRGKIKALPVKIYMNKILQAPFGKVMDELITTGLHREIKTWDGCYNVRYQRGSRTMLSRHSWGLAIDLNATWNPLVSVNAANRAALRAKYVQWSEPFLDIWRKHGFECGADWTNKLDGMHFELK
jgi:hypothetical protein